MFNNSPFGAKAFISERINSLGYYATFYPPQTKNPTRDIPQQQGSFNECIFDLICRQYFPQESIIFEEQNAWEQFLKGRNNKVDAGWDIIVNDMKIDVKYDSKMYDAQKVCFEIKSASGTPTLLLNNNVDRSAHMAYFERNLPNVFKDKNKGLQLVIVDLHKLREYLSEDSGTYKIGNALSRVTRFGTVCIDIPVNYLTHTLKVADNFIY